MLAVLLSLLISMVAVSPARAVVAPPWCGDPVPDAAENLPDGTDPSDPPGSFPHIPYYAIRCTLEDIVASSQGRMSLEVIGSVRAGPRPVPRHRQRAGHRAAAEGLPGLAAGAQGRADRPGPRPGTARSRYGDDVKVPLFIQGGIHGNEYEGVEAIFETLEKLATTPYGADPEVDAVLDHTVLLFNVIQNPDGRVAGTRANGNGFDLNRDFMTQSQPETRASVAVMQKWLPPEVLDLHGYVTPTLDRGDDQAAQPEHRLRPVAQVEPAAHRCERGRAGGAQLRRHPADQRLVLRREPGPASGICPDGSPPGPAVAEGWDDWGPFYTADVRPARRPERFDGRDVQPDERQRTAPSPAPRRTRCGPARVADHPGDRGLVDACSSTSRTGTSCSSTSSSATAAASPTRRARRAASRRSTSTTTGWRSSPTAYIVPMGTRPAQRARGEPAGRLAARSTASWSTSSSRPTPSTASTYPAGSYVVPMTQARRGLADTALGIGADISEDISILYAPPAAWSHGYLWGADVVRVPRERRLHAADQPDHSRPATCSAESSRAPRPATR